MTQSFCPSVLALFEQSMFFYIAEIAAMMLVNELRRSCPERLAGGPGLVGRAEGSFAAADWNALSSIRLRCRGALGHLAKEILGLGEERVFHENAPHHDDGMRAKNVDRQGRVQEMDVEGANDRIIEVR
ncbi:hypothetical protein [Bradyrhizobium sp. 62]|uniref:hypothetical protein n=1 Tax=Bradyrhizobium sp. 62 TaxID=1043588 RepID=UPI001FF7E5C4|nr:hypothetical protein [Bradyrhizobium sp. 62]MCK1367322.1 hypothetical protein [Bradyrhizobium sp. 62]